MLKRHLARERIKQAIDLKSPDAHDVISLILRQIAKRYGSADANKLICDFNLTKRYGIAQLKPKYRKYLGPLDQDLTKSLSKVRWRS